MPAVSPFRSIVALIMASLLTACAGTGVPVRPYGHYDSDTETELPLTRARERAAFQLAEWDKSLQHLQGANTTAGSVLPALAGLVGFRAARQKSAPATAALAATGLIGMSIADAMVQLSRLNVYIEGIAALECAVIEYDAVGLQAIRDKVDSKALRESTNPAAVLAHRDFLALYDKVSGPLDVAFGHAVSRIARDANKALAGSIVSVQSRPVGDGFTNALRPSTDKLPSTKALEANRSRGMKAAGVASVALDQQDRDEERLLEATEELLAERSAAVSAAVDEIDKCSFGATTAAIEQRPVATPLTLRAVGFEGKPVVIANGAKVQIIVTGGLPDYSVELRPNDATKLTQEYLKVSGAHIIELTWKSSVAPGEEFMLYVSDSATPKATLLLPVKTTP